MIKIAATILSFMVCVTTFTTVAAKEIGLSLPFTGRGTAYAELVKSGVELAVRQAEGITLKIVDDRCDPKLANDIAEKFSNASIVIGPMCFETATAISAALNPTTATTKRPLIALKTRNNLLARARQFDGLELYALAKKSNAEAKAIVELGFPRFNGKPFAIVDDGSVHGRTLADDIRLLGDQEGFKPVILVNYRPLRSNQRAMLRRLQRTGVEALVISGEAEDVVTILRDMKALNLTWPVLIGEQASMIHHTQGADDVSNELLVIRETLPEVEEDALFERLLNENKLRPDPALLTGYALAQIAIMQMREPDTELGTKKFETILGSYRFGSDGRAEFSPYQLHHWDGNKFVPVGS